MHSRIVRYDIRSPFSDSSSWSSFNLNGFPCIPDKGFEKGVVVRNLLILTPASDGCFYSYAMNDTFSSSSSYDYFGPGSFGINANFSWGGCCMSSFCYFSPLNATGVNGVSGAVNKFIYSNLFIFSFFVGKIVSLRFLLSIR